MTKELLPVGSVVYLEEGTVPLVIITVEAFVKSEDDDNLLFNFDYTGVPYPQGLVEEEVFYFHHENISEILFEGYKNEQHSRYLKSIEEWKGKNSDTFIKGNVE